MNDVYYIAIFLLCCAATYGLIWLCGRLMPDSTSQSRSKP